MLAFLKLSKVDLFLNQEAFERECHHYDVIVVKLVKRVCVAADNDKPEAQPKDIPVLCSCSPERSR